MEALMRLLIGSCESAAAHLSEHAEGELRGLRHVRVRLHLQLCAGCKAALETLRTTIDALHSLARIEPEPNPELARVVLERIRAEGQERDR